MFILNSIKEINNILLQIKYEINIDCFISLGSISDNVTWFIEHKSKKNWF